MRITRPRATKLSQITIDGHLDLSGGDYDIIMKIGRTVDGEDVSAHVAAVSPHSGHTIMKTGSIVGDDSANRAIAHGLGRVPKFIFFQVTATLYDFSYGFLSGDGTMLTSITAVTGDLLNFAVTGWDATNFYVGNATGYNHSFNGIEWSPITWVAFG